MYPYQKMLKWIYRGRGKGPLNPPEIKKIRHYNTQTWSQNAANPISEDLNFQNCPEGGFSQTLLQDTAFGSGYLKLPFLKPIIHTRNVQVCDWYNFLL